MLFIPILWYLYLTEKKSLCFELNVKEAQI